MARKCSIAVQILDVFPAALSLLIFILIVPVILTALIPIQFYKCALVLYVKLFKKDIIHVMAGNNPIMAMDNMHTRPLCVVVGYGAFEDATVEHLSQLVRNCILETDSATGEIQYPETHQFYEEWMGYIWWKWEQNFKIENHISIWNEGRDKRNPVLEKDFMRIVATLEAKPFIRERSPWDIVIVENILLQNVKEPETPKAGIIFRFQHGITDGVSLLQFVMKCVFTTDQMEKMQSPVIKQSTAVQKIFQLGTILELPYQFAKQLVCSFDLNEWHIRESKLSRKIYRSWTKRIPISLIKDIKNRNNVGFTSVLISVIAGALRKLMTKHNVKVPKQMHALVPLPWPNHPKNLCNHWSFGFLELPTGLKDDLRRLQHVHNYIEGMKMSLLPAFNFFVITLINRLPTWILKYVNVVQYLPTVLISNFPGPPPESISLGCNLVDSMFTGTFPGNMGIHICILSYDNAVRIVLGVDSSIFQTQEMTDDLIEILENEFYELRNLNKQINFV